MLKESKMRWTFLMPPDDLTGGNRVVATYAMCLQKLGHDVLVVSSAADKPTLRKWLSTLVRGRWKNLMRLLKPLPGHVANSGVPHKVLTRKRAINANDLPEADVVVATWWETANWMHALPISKGRKLHLIQGYEIWFDPAQTPLVHEALCLPNLKIAISNGLKQTIEDKLGPLNIHVVPNAVDLVQFNAPPRVRNAVPKVGYIYAHAAIKGADVCTAACELARQQIPNLQVLSFGVDELLSPQALPTGTQYFLRPDQSILASLYAQCDLWLFGSRLDSFGLPILEAMACRTPVIGVPIGAAPDLLGNGGGVLVPGESPQAMADAMVSVLSEASLDWLARSDMAHARAHAYSWNEATQRLLGLLKNDVTDDQESTSHA
jgi:glycosyltransferase involved in cell wall biosynthesis